MHKICINIPAPNTCRMQCYFSEVYLLIHEALLLAWLHNPTNTFFSDFTITLSQSLPHEFDREILIPGGSENLF